MRTGGGLLQRSRTVREGLGGPRHARALPRACVRACLRACLSAHARARAHVSLSIGRCVSLGAGVERQVRSLLCRQRKLRQNRESDVPSPKLRMCETHRYDREAFRDRSCADPYWPGRWSVPLDTLHFVAIWRHAAQLRRTWNAHEPRAALTPQAAWRARPELPLSARSLPSNRYGTARRVHASRRCAATAGG